MYQQLRKVICNYVAAQKPTPGVYTLQFPVTNESLYFVKADNNERWITLKPHGEDSEHYVRVLVRVGEDGTAEVVSGSEGPKGLKGLKLSRLKSPKERKPPVKERKEEKGSVTESGEPQSQEEGESGLQTFAGKVEAAARNSKTGWFGDNKVFVSHVWEQLKAEGNDFGLTMEEYKDYLIEASKEGLVRLARADLPDAADPRDVESSEISYLTGVFHFIFLD